MASNQTVTIFGKIPPKYIKEAPPSQKKEVYGLAFPLGSNPAGGFFSAQTGIPMITSAVKQLIMTSRGERVMLPNFGTNLRKYLFQPLNEGTFDSIKREIQYSFEKYIVGAKIVKLAVFPFGEAGPAGGNSIKVILSLKLDVLELEIFDVEVNIS